MAINVNNIYSGTFNEHISDAPNPDEIRTSIGTRNLKPELGERFE
jgi:hypothetical protein